MCTWWFLWQCPQQVAWGSGGCIWSLSGSQKTLACPLSGSGGGRERGRKTGWPVVLCLTSSTLPPPRTLPGPASSLSMTSHSWARGRKGTFWILGVLRAELGEGLFSLSSCTPPAPQTHSCLFRRGARSHGSHLTLARPQPPESLLGLTSSSVKLPGHSLGHSCDENEPAGASGVYKEQMKSSVPTGGGVRTTLQNLARYQAHKWPRQ